MSVRNKAVFPADLIDSGMRGGTAVFLRVWKTRMESLGLRVLWEAAEGVGYA